MRVFLGLTEISNIIFTLSKGFRALGHETCTMVITKNTFYPDSNYDVVLRESAGVTRNQVRFPRTLLICIRAWLKLLFMFLKALATCDVFVFVFGTSFLPHYLDYPLLKLFGKRIVSIFLGDDVRYYYALEQEARLLGLEDALRQYLDYRRPKSDLTDALMSKLLTVNMAERYANLILSQPSHAGLQTRPYMRINIPIDLSEYSFHLPTNGIPIIIHAPTDRGVKGTTHVLSAIDQLQRDGVHLSYAVLERVPNEQLRRALSTADIVVDQVYSTTLSTLSLEALAAGCVVMTRQIAWYSGLPSGCPAINVDKNTLANQLRRVISDPALRSRLAYAGRAYVERHHGHMRIAQHILDCLKQNGVQKYDFVPSFFSDYFMVPSIVLKEEIARMKKQGRGRSRLRGLALWPLTGQA